MLKITRPRIPPFRWNSLATSRVIPNPLYPLSFPTAPSVIPTAVEGSLPAGRHGLSKDPAKEISPLRYTPVEMTKKCHSGASLSKPFRHLPFENKIGYNLLTAQTIIINIESNIKYPMCNT